MEPQPTQDPFNFDPADVARMFTWWDFLLIGLVWIMVHLIQERFPEPFQKPRLGWSLSPFIGIPICVPAMFVHGPWFPAGLDPSVAERVMLGFVLGIGAHFFGAIAARTPLGKALNAVGVNWIVEKTGGTKVGMKAVDIKAPYDKPSEPKG